jgi:hypothetical protein
MTPEQEEIARLTGWHLGTDRPAIMPPPHGTEFAGWWYDADGTQVASASTDAFANRYAYTVLQARARAATWQQPRAADGSIWMDIAVYDGPRILLSGRVSWPKDGGLYAVSMTYENENGLGLYCWPDFRVLSDAQDFVEKLMQMRSADAKRIHGTQWPGVVL